MTNINLQYALHISIIKHSTLINEDTIESEVKNPLLFVKLKPARCTSGIYIPSQCEITKSQYYSFIPNCYQSAQIKYPFLKRILYMFLANINIKRIIDQRLYFFFIKLYLMFCSPVRRPVSVVECFVKKKTYCTAYPVIFIHQLPARDAGPGLNFTLTIYYSYES